MLTFKRISSSPLDPYERSSIAKTKALKKLESDFYQLILKDKNAFKIVGVNETDDTITIHAQIPSEPFYSILRYDTIVEFHKEDGRITPSSQVKVFSNSPSFIFTYTYVYNINDGLIGEYKNLHGSISLNEPPNRTNPKRLVGFEKSLFFTFLFFRQLSLFMDIEAFKIRPEVKNSVNKVKRFTPMPADQKLKQYNLAKKQLKDLYNDYNKRNKFGFF